MWSSREILGRTASWLALLGAGSQVFLGSLWAVDVPAIQRKDASQPQPGDEIVEVVWEQAISYPPDGFGTVLGSETLLVFDEESLTCLTRESGELLWQQSVNINWEVFPVRGGSCWMLALADHSVAALDSLTGRTIWVKNYPGPVQFLVGEEKHVAVVQGDGTLSMLSSADGQVLWQKQLEGGVSVAPVFIGEDACVVASGSTLSAYQCGGGREKWKEPIKVRADSPLAKFSDEVFALATGPTVWCVNAQTGEVHWSCDAAQALIAKPIPVEIVAVTDEHLFLHRDWGRLTALSRHTGELRSVNDIGEHLRAPPLVISDQVVFATSSRAGSLTVFDRQAEVVHDRIALPEGSKVLNAARHHVLAQTDAGRLAWFDIRPPAPDPYREPVARLGAPFWRALAPPMAICLALLLGSLVFILAGTPRIPSTLMSSLLLCATLVCTGALCAVTARMGWLILKEDSLGSLVAVVLAVALFSPTLYLAGWQMALWWQHRQKGSNRVDQLTNPESVKVIQRLTRDMGLPAETDQRIIESPEGPYVSGVSSRRFHICLPRDLDARASRACGGDRQQTVGLLRLVLAHELAHVRNGDILFLPLLTVARQRLPACFAVIAVSAVVCHWFSTEAMVSSLARGLVPMVIAGGLALWVLLKLALRERERLADATASLIVSPVVVRDLTRPNVNRQEMLPPLVNFLVGLRIGSWGRKRVLGFGGDSPSRIAARWSSWLRTHLEVESVGEFELGFAGRSKALVQKDHALGEWPAKNWGAALAAGILAGLLLAAFAHWVAMDFIGYLLEHRPRSAQSVDAGFLQAYPAWSEQQDQSIGWKVARTLTPLIAAMLLAGTALLPWRDTARKMAAPGYGVWRNTLGSLLLALVVAGVVFSVASPGRFPFPSFPMLRVSAVGLWLWSGVAGLLFASLMIVRTSTRRLHRLLLEVSILLMVVIAASLVCWHLLEGLSTTGRLIWVMALLMASSIVLTSKPFGWLLAQEDYSDESLRFIRIFGVTRLFCNRLGGGVDLTWRQIPWLVAYGLAVYGLPLWLVAVPLESSLLKLDSARFELSRTRNIAVARLMDVAVDRIQADRGSFSREFLPLLVQRRIFDPLGPRPSTWLGIGVVTVLCLGGFCQLSWRSVRGRGRDDLVTASAAAMASLFERLELPGLRQRFWARLEKTIERIDTPVRGAGGVPLLIRTCWVSGCAAHLNVDWERHATRQAWVLNHEAGQGGFGPNGEATLQHTAAALQMLRIVGAQPALGYQVHERWLRRQLAECWRRRFVLQPSTWLNAVGLIAEGLDQIDGAVTRLSKLTRFGREMGIAAFRIWQSSEQSTRDTRQLVTILACWPTSSRPLFDTLTTSWLRVWESRPGTWHPETELKELADSIILLSRMFPGSYTQRSSVIQVADNLEKHWRRVR